MKRPIAGLVVATALLVSGGVGRAEWRTANEYDDSMMHPLHLAYYLIHPVGYTVEWLVGRPIHYIISRPQLENVFGYRPTEEAAAYRASGD